MSWWDGSGVTLFMAMQARTKDSYCRPGKIHEFTLFLVYHIANRSINPSGQVGVHRTTDI